jgi:hypothetical protein
MLYDLKWFQDAEALPFIRFSCFHATGVQGAVEIESEWTARILRPLIAIKPR